MKSDIGLLIEGSHKQKNDRWDKREIGKRCDSIVANSGLRSFFGHGISFFQLNSIREKWRSASSPSRASRKDTGICPAKTQIITR
jgi:hypothetical protein